MIKRLMVAAVAVAGLSLAMPAGAEEVGVGVGVGPAGVGVTVGSSNDRYREREVIRERDRRDRDETVVIKQGAITIVIATIGGRSSSTATGNPAIVLEFERAASLAEAVRFCVNAGCVFPRCPAQPTQ